MAWLDDLMAQGSNKDPHADALEALAALSGGGAATPAKQSSPKAPAPAAVPPGESKPPVAKPVSAPKAPAVPPIAPSAPSSPVARPPVPRSPANPPQPPKAKPPTPVETPFQSNDPLAALAAAASGSVDREAYESGDGSRDDSVGISPRRGEAASDSEAISASGFVGMLAKGKVNESDPELPPVKSSGAASRDEAPRRAAKPQVAKAIEGEPGNLRNAPRPNLAVPLPRNAEELAQAKVPRDNRLNKIALAREVELTRAVDAEDSVDDAGAREEAVESPEEPVERTSSPKSRSSSAKRAPVAPVPSWYKGAVPVMFTLTGILMLISIWAIGAVACMAANVQNAWPLIEFDSDDGVFTSGSKLMAGSMLAALPIAILIGILALMMQRQIKRSERA